MYSFQQCLFPVWNVKSKPVCFESRDVQVKAHVVYLPNPEHLREDVGSGRPVSGRIQQSNAVLTIPETAVGDISLIWLLEQEPKDMPTMESLLMSNVGMLCWIPKEERDKIRDFPGELAELYAAPLVPSGIMFNSGDVRRGGLYMLFRSDIEEPIDMVVRIRMEVNINNV